MIFQQIRLGTSVIPQFNVILTGQSISEIILIIQGHLQGQKVNFKVKLAKISFLTSNARNICNISFSWDFDWKIHLWYHLGSKGQFQGQVKENIIFN